MSAPGRDATRSAQWRTRVDPAVSAAFSAGELHAVFFEHKTDRGGVADATVGLMIPEVPMPAVTQCLDAASARRSRVFFICDIREQADEVAALAATRLKQHRRVPYERAVAAGWGIAQ